MSKILDDFLFKKRGQHGLCDLRLATKIIEVSVVSWEDGNLASIYLFDNAKLVHIGMTDNSPEELEIPWDIISIDEKNHLNGVWEFTLHCSCMSLTFLASWPIER